MRTVRFVNPQKQYQDFKEEFLKTVDDVFSRGDLIYRGDLENFENEIAEFVGVKYAIGVNSGTDALSLSMEAAGIGPGDEVVTVGHTFMASISAIYHQDAEAVLIDVGPDFNMDPKLIEKALTKRTKAIEPVHLNGRVCDMEAILDIAKRKGLMVIEDACQSLGAKLRMKDGTWKKSGSFGLAGCFSMYPFKILGAFGDAGIVTTNDADMARKVRLLRYNGESREDRKFYYHGYTALLDNVQAALLSIKLKYLPQWIERRRKIAESYRNGLKDIKELTLPHFEDEHFYDVYQNYVIRTRDRDQLKKFLDDKGIETMISWPSPTYREPVMMPNKISLPETEKICHEVLSLPMFPELPDADINYTIQAIRGFYGL